MDNSVTAGQRAKAADMQQAVHRNGDTGRRENGRRFF